MRQRFAGFLFVIVIVAGLVASGCAGLGRKPGGGPIPMVIIDSDYNTMSDDGQLGVMAVQLQAEGRLRLMGITVVSGNQWLMQGVSDALMSMERLGAGERVGVYAGADHPLDHDFASVQAEMKAGAGGDGYLGAYMGPEPKSVADLKPSPDGFARHTRLRDPDAVDFIVDTVKAHPGRITILAVGPLTNIALATQRHPEIVPLIQQIIYMGGAIEVAGNTTRLAEFNWWFDPDAARAVLRLPIPQVVIPLDVTDTVNLTKPVYDRIAHSAHPTAVTEVFRQLNGRGFDGQRGFDTDPSYTQNIWDTLTLAYLVDPGYATETVQRYLDVVARPGAPDNGRSIGYAEQPAGAPLQKVTVVKKFDNARFFDFYVDLLTRPVPVVLPP